MGLFAATRRDVSFGCRQADHSVSGSARVLATLVIVLAVNGCGLRPAAASSNQHRHLSGRRARVLWGTADDHMSSSGPTIYGAERSGRETVERAVHWLQHQLNSKPRAYLLCETVERAVHWLQQHSDRRFFLFVHLYDPHEPYQAPAEVAARFPSPPTSPKWLRRTPASAGFWLH